MLYLTIALFALAAILGIIMLKNWLTSAKTPRAVVYTHGAFAALALLLLVTYLVNHPSSSLKTALVLFVIAALGGFFMFFRELKGKLSPVWLAIIHGLLAVAGFLFLLFTVL